MHKVHSSTGQSTLVRFSVVDQPSQSNMLRATLVSSHNYPKWKMHPSVERIEVNFASDDGEQTVHTVVLTPDKPMQFPLPPHEEECSWRGKFMRFNAVFKAGTGTRGCQKDDSTALEVVQCFGLHYNGKEGI